MSGGKIAPTYDIDTMDMSTYRKLRESGKLSHCPDPRFAGETFTAMSNTILVPAMITKEALMLFENDVTLAKRCDMQYRDEFARDDLKIGASLNVRLW